MLVRNLRDEGHHLFNSVVNNPLQSWEWGAFKQKNGNHIERVGFYKNGQIEKGIQVSFHDVPQLKATVGYCPKGFAPTEDQISALQQLGKKNKAIFSRCRAIAR